MKTLHWTIVALLVVALLAIPTWYSLTGVGAEAVADEQTRTLRSNGNRTIIGGGSRFGK